MDTNVEIAVMVWLSAGKEILKEFVGFILKDIAICGPNAIWKLESVDFIFLSSNDGLSVEESVVLVSKFNPHLSRFLVPKHLFLEKNVIIFLLKLFF